jgi:hypothetical protein
MKIIVWKLLYLSISDNMINKIDTLLIVYGLIFLSKYFQNLSSIFNLTDMKI